MTQAPELEVGRAAKRSIRALTSIRGFAAWFVVVYHFREGLPHWTPEFIARLSGYGYLAVDLFFIMSGFVIALNYLGPLSKSGGTRSVLSFYGNRIARIYPLHFVVMVMYLSVPIGLALFSTQGLPQSGYDVGYYLLSLLLVQNWGLAEPMRWNIPAWSISTEWFSYLVFPLIIAALRAMGGRAGLLRLALLLVALAGVGALAGGLGGEIERLGLIRCVIEFCIGVCIQQTLSAWRLVRRQQLLALLSMVACLASPIWLPDYFLVPLGLVLLVALLVQEDGLLVDLLSTRWLEWLGEISYSTYLVHYLVKLWVKFLLVDQANVSDLPFVVYILATLLLSVALYYGVERPGQRQGRRLVSRLFPAQAAGAGLAPVTRSAAVPQNPGGLPG